MPENRILLSKLFQTTEELDTPEIAHINGEIPKWVRGTFMRTGPAKWDFPSGENTFMMKHWLDGYALLSKFTIKGSQVTFEKKFLKSDAYQRAMKSNRPLVTEFGTSKQSDPNKGFFGRLVSAVMPIELSDNNTIALFTIGKELFATGETCYFHKVEKNLSTGEKFDTNRYFGTNLASAHPVYDESSGAMYNIGSSVITGTKFNIIRIPSPASNASAKDLLKKSQIICSIPSSYPTGLMSYNHSFSMANNKYICFIEQPFVMNLGKAAMTYLKNPPLKEWLEWRPELKNRFHLVVTNNDSGKLIKTEYISSESFMFLHVVNSYEENEQVVVDILAYDDPSFLDCMYMKDLRRGETSFSSLASCRRFVIPLNVKDTPENVNLVDLKSDAKAIRVGCSIILTPEIITQEGVEMPIINGKFVGQKYEYFYGSGNSVGNHFSNAIYKVSTKKHETVLWKGRGDDVDYLFPGEPQFIPNPNPKSEDDGVIISAVTDSREDASDFLLFLDARSMEEIGRATYNAHIPQALHGILIH